MYVLAIKRFSRSGNKLELRSQLLESSSLPMSAHKIIIEDLTSMAFAGISVAGTNT